MKTIREIAGKRAGCTLSCITQCETFDTNEEKKACCNRLVGKEIDLNTIDKDINTLFKVDLNPFDFIYGKSGSCYGDDPENGPLWIRPNSLYVDAIEKIDQIVGHTQPRNPIIIKSQQNTNIYLNDMLGLGYYLITLDNSVLIKNIN